MKLFRHLSKWFGSGVNDSSAHENVKGKDNIIERNGGRVVVHSSALLNSEQHGYHVGMPFETTLMCDAPDSLIEIGEACRIHGSYIHAWSTIKIGRSVLIAAGTNIVDSNGHSSDIRYARFRQHFKDVAKPIEIGDFVWIGMNSTILKGVHIGECAIVSAGSIVTQDVPAFSVVAGNPAAVIHTFDESEALPENHPIETLLGERGFFKY